MKRRGGGALVILLVGVIALWVMGISPEQLREKLTEVSLEDAQPETGTGRVEDVDDEQLEEAAADLARLEVADLEDVAGYDREQFGQRWADIDRNGCDQRNDALRAAARDITAEPGTGGCVILEAEISDPYTGTTISFVKGEDQVDIDHVVPLSRAWSQGAADWDEERREEFANTAENLLAVDASANRSKGDSGPEQWMPEAGRCGYAIQWITVKTTFELTISSQEKRALEDEMTTCEESA